jgi:hypothetical protein
MREQRFEAAKSAASNRAVTSLAALDQAVAASPDAATRRADGRTFTLRDGAWTDIRYRSNMKAVSVKPYSKAYFDLLAQLPELRAVFALGDSVVVVGRSEAIRLDANGAAELSAAELSRLTKAW